MIAFSTFFPKIIYMGVDIHKYMASKIDRSILIDYLPVEFERNLVRTGHGKRQYVITLPNDWVRLNQRKHGDFDKVRILARGDVLIIRPKIEE